MRGYRFRLRRPRIAASQGPLLDIRDRCFVRMLLRMKDLRAKLEKLQADAEDCLLISQLATDRAKRELFAHLAAQLQGLAEDVEIAIARQMAHDGN